HGHPAEVDLLLLRSMARRELGQLQEALADLDLFLAVKKLSHAFAARGEVRRRLGDLPGALADLDHSVTLCATDPFATISRGRVHLAEGRAEAAVRDFEAALALDPESIAAYH